MLTIPISLCQREDERETHISSHTKSSIKLLNKISRIILFLDLFFYVYISHSINLLGCFLAIVLFIIYYLNWLKIMTCSKDINLLALAELPYSFSFLLSFLPTFIAIYILQIVKNTHLYGNSVNLLLNSAVTVFLSFQALAANNFWLTKNES